MRTRYCMTLDELLLCQSSYSGAWNNCSEISCFFREPALTERDPMRFEVAAMVSDSFEAVWATVLALFVLTRKFANKEDEWQLIANKAKAFLRSKGIAKPDALIKSINIDLL